MFTQREQIILEKSADILREIAATNKKIHEISMPGVILSFLCRCRRAGLPSLHIQALTKLDMNSPSGRCALHLSTLGGEIVVMVGPSGCGKTLAITAAAVKTVFSELWSSQEQKKIVSYYTARNFFAACRAGFDDDKNERDTARIYEKPYVLIIDELSEASMTPYECRMLTAAIDARYHRQRMTILLGNTAPESLAGVVGPSVASRIRECGVAIDCTNWPNWRTGPKAAMKKLNFMDDVPAAAPEAAPAAPSPEPKPTPTAPARRTAKGGKK